jgi:PKD repeat protein
VLYAQIFELANETDQGDSIPGAEPGTMLWRAYSSMNFTTPFNGNGTLLITTFKVIGVGSSLLNAAVALADNYGRELLWHQYNGYFHTPGAPVADFSFWPDVSVVNKPTVFNASASYSPLGYSIANYAWNFGDGNVTVVTNPIVYHTYTAKLEASVSLTVADTNGTSSSPKTVTFSVVDLRNVKVTSVTLGQVQAVVNTTVNVTVTVSDDGEADENCTAAAYYNTTAVDFNSIYNTNWTKIDEQDVSLTTTHRDKILFFAWNTTGVPVLSADYYVLVNTTLVPFEENATDNLKISQVPVNVVPEIQSWLILPIFMTATLLAVIVYKRKAHRQRYRTVS